MALHLKEERLSLLPVLSLPLGIATPSPIKKVRIPPSFFVGKAFPLLTKSSRAPRKFFRRYCPRPSSLVTDLFPVTRPLF